MPRIRSIKPEFWVSEQVMECSPTTRLLFIGLWNFCDDHGRLPLKPKQIKASIFPGDDISAIDVQGMIHELSRNKLILTYTVDEQEYLWVTGWHHQRIDKRQSPKYPGPDRCSSENTPDLFPPDRIGKEEDRIGKKEVYTVDFENFWNVYPSRQPHSNPKKPASPKFEAAIRRGVDAQVIIDGAVRYAEYIRREGTNPKHVAQATTWLNQERWNDNNSAPPRREPTQGEIAG